MSDRNYNDAGVERDSTSSISLSVALMHHPSRQDTIHKIIDRCAPLDIDVVTDPDPDGVPSPLRTARLAWRAAGTGSTHHMVLQDDVVPAQGFAEKVLHLVASRPDDVIALSTNSDSPCNSYQVRCAAAGGRAFATLVPWEWVPTLGLILPTSLAGDLSDYLDGLGPDSRADDLAIAEFLRIERRRVIVPVPHLLEHGGGASVMGNSGEGPRRSTLVRRPPDVDGPDWSGLSQLPSELLHGRPEEYLHTIALQRSRCVVDTPKLGDGLWPAKRRWRDWGDWLDACPYFGVTPGVVLAGYREHVPMIGDALAGAQGRDEAAAELWAAGFLLGLDAARRDPACSALPVSASWEGPALESLRTWVRVGLDQRDAAALVERDEDLLARYVLQAVLAGRNVHAVSR